jgi:hypothetical protein
MSRFLDETDHTYFFKLKNCLRLFLVIYAFKPSAPQLERALLTANPVTLLCGPCHQQCVRKRPWESHWCQASVKGSGN